MLRIVAENPTSHSAARTTDPATRVGLGILGMRERVRAAGGSVEAGSIAETTWRVEAALPLSRLASHV